VSPTIGPERNGPGDQEDAEPPDHALLQGKNAGEQCKGEEQGGDELISMAESCPRRQDEEMEQQEDEHHGQAPLLGPESKEAGKSMLIFSRWFLHTGESDREAADCWVKCSTAQKPRQIDASGVCSGEMRKNCYR
jgi:hypothetical protein